MDNWFQSKWVIRLLALAFAITLFIFVNVETNTTGSDSSIPGRTTQVQTLDDVPVEIEIDSENYVVTGVPEFATVTLEGTPAVVTPAIFNRNFSVYVDLTEYGEGSHTVDLEHTISGDMRVYIEPKTIEVTIEERASETFPITVEFLNTDQLPPGYEVSSYELDQPEVTVTTSREIMEQVGVVKIYVDVANAEGSIQNREVPINVYDTQGNELQVRLDRESAVVSVEFDNPSKVVPLDIETTGELPEDFSLVSMSANVDEVEIFAVSDVLEGVSTVSTEPIDLSEVTESGTVNVGLDLPAGVNTGELETIEVTIEVEELEDSLVIEAMTIEDEELGDGQDLTFVEPEEAEMDMLITGTETAISEFSSEDFRIFINVADLEEGEHLVPVNIEWEETEEVTLTPEYEEVTVEIVE